MGILLKNGRVIDPASGKDGVYDLLVEDGVIVSVDDNISEDGHKVIDTTGCFIMPGLVDLHVHFREPGFEYKETIKTGSLAAARGGVTTVLPMPNTKPVADSVEVINRINEIVARDSVVNVLQVASVTMGQEGNVVTDIEALHDMGVVADRKSVV